MLKRTCFAALVMLLTISSTGWAMSVKILDPAREKAKVSCEMDVRGTANIPSGDHVWVLVHRTEGFEDVWWPQNEAKVDPLTKTWKAHVVFGQKNDISYEFEIAAVVLNEQEAAKLKAYRKEALKTGDWRPIDMPPTEIAPVIRKVMKVGHDGCAE